MGKSSRRAAAVRTVADGEEIPAVGMREPCPCGSGKRYKACHGRPARSSAGALVVRPFVGLPSECDWVAMREIVPAATATATLRSSEHGEREVTLSTVLPMAWPALHRADGTIFVGLQTAVSSSDASRDVAHAMLRAIDSEPGTPVLDGVAPPDGPRLQDLLDLDAPFTVTVHEGFDYWISNDVERSAEVQESMDRANGAVVPTRRLSSVEAAYWAKVGNRRHLRWVMGHAEDDLLNALARLHVSGDLNLINGGRYIGAFRTDGLIVPVWDTPAEADDLEEPAAAFAKSLTDALAQTDPLTAAERGARAGVVSRQLTLR